MLIKSCNYETCFQLPCYLYDNKNNIIKKVYRYYDSEKRLYSAYYQLKKLNGFLRPLSPIVYEDLIDKRLYYN